MIFLSVACKATQVEARTRANTGENPTGLRGCGTIYTSRVCVSVIGEYSVLDDRFGCPPKRLFLGPIPKVVIFVLLNRARPTQFATDRRGLPMWWSDTANPMRFVTGCVCLSLTIATVQAFVGCGSSKFPSGELVMFTAFGPHAFEGRVVVARPEVRTESAREVAILSLDFVRPVVLFAAFLGTHERQLLDGLLSGSRDSRISTFRVARHPSVSAPTRSFPVVLIAYPQVACVVGTS